MQGTENGRFDDTIQEERLFRNEKVKEVYDAKGKFEIPFYNPNEESFAGDESDK